MEYFLLKLLPIFLVYFLIFSKQIHCQCKDIHVFTPDTREREYIFYPASKVKKCFSFEVRAPIYPHVILGDTPSNTNYRFIEVIPDHQGKMIIRKNYTILKTIPNSGFINDKELRGFWIRWLDDQFVEVGRNTDHNPIISCRMSEKFDVNYIGILSYTTTAEWILHEDPQCGAYNNITKIIPDEIKCNVETTNLNSVKNNTLEKLQQHILNQIKNQHGISKGNSLRCKEILLVYQELIEKLYRKAEENQNQIYAEDNENYSPLKAITFNKITKEYLQFMAEIQMELAVIKETTPSEVKRVNDFGNCCGCCSSAKLKDMCAI